MCGVNLDAETRHRALEHRQFRNRPVVEKEHRRDALERVRIVTLAHPAPELGGSATSAFEGRRLPEPWRNNFPTIRGANDGQVAQPALRCRPSGQVNINGFAFEAQCLPVEAYQIQPRQGVVIGTLYRAVTGQQLVSQQGQATAFNAAAWTGRRCGALTWPMWAISSPTTVFITRPARVLRSRVAEGT